MAQASRDENRVTTLLGVSELDGTTPTPVAVDPNTNRLLVDTTIDASDIQIGAVEIKDGTTDARAVVGVNGLEVEVKASALPAGAATSAKQDTQIANETVLISLIDTLQELNQRLAPLGGAMATTASLRITPIASVSTAVTGPATSAQVIAALLTQTNTLWLNNTTAIQSNINNVVVTN